MSILDATRFMMAQQLGRYDVAHEQTIQIQAGRHNYAADLYLNKGTSKGTVVFIHGMSVNGNRDERIKIVGRSLATVGYRVVAPLIPSIKNLEIDPAQAHIVADILRAISGDSDLTRSGRLGLMAPSFSAAMSLKAIGNSDVRSIVSSLCVIGGYADLYSTLDFLINEQEADEYGRMLVLWNYISTVIGRRKHKVIEAFKIAATDNGLHLTPEEGDLVPYLAGLSQKDQDFFKQIRYDVAYRTQLWQKAMATKQVSSSVKKMDVMHMVENVRTPITLIHGRHDDVIHADQSELLYDQLVKQGTPAHLCITSIISHGDSVSGIKMLPEAVGLARAFGYFFKQMGRI